MRVFQGLVTAYISSHKYKEALTAAKANTAPTKSPRLTVASRPAPQSFVARRALSPA